MATVVNNTGQPAPVQTESTNNGMGMIVGALLLIAVVFLVIFYGLPALRQAATPSTPSVTVPDQIDVNVQTPQGE